MITQIMSTKKPISLKGVVFVVRDVSRLLMVFPKKFLHCFTTVSAVLLPLMDLTPKDDEAKKQKAQHKQDDP